jgi:1-acyl-sn-glycerol-3-phosphate acyltransferase
MMQASKLAKLATGGKHMARGMFHALAELGHSHRTPVKDASEGAHRLAATLGLIARSHGIRVRVSGDVPRMPSLLVCNHVSYLDPLAILPLCPAIPLAKSEVADWPVVGPVAKQLGVAFIDRNDAMQRAATLRRLTRMMAQGVSVLNFAEGTTTDGRTVAPFWRGSFGVAQQLELPVVPLAIRYDDPKMAWTGGAAFLPHYTAMAQKRSIGVSLVIGSPLYPRTGEPPEHFAARTRNAVSALLHRVTPMSSLTSVSSTTAARPPVLTLVPSTPSARNSSYAAIRARIPATRSESIFSVA